jgi:hypothetical protein
VSVAALDPNRRGQAYALTVATPVVPGEEDALRAYLENLTESPLARLERTHFGRFVIVPAFHTEDSQPGADPLGCPLLIFSVTFDGPRDSYLDELCDGLGAEAVQIWGRCVGAGSARGAELKAYLRHNQVRTGFFVAAYPDATVPAVRRCVALRARMIGFATRSQAMRPSQLRRAFADEFGFN